MDELRRQTLSTLRRTFLRFISANQRRKEYNALLESMLRERQSDMHNLYAASLALVPPQETTRRPLRRLGKDRERFLSFELNEAGLGNHMSRNEFGRYYDLHLSAGAAGSPTNCNDLEALMADITLANARVRTSNASTSKKLSRKEKKKRRRTVRNAGRAQLSPARMSPATRVDLALTGIQIVDRNLRLVEGSHNPEAFVELAQESVRFGREEMTAAAAMNSREGMTKVQSREPNYDFSGANIGQMVLGDDHRQGGVNVANFNNQKAPSQEQYNALLARAMDALEEDRSRLQDFQAGVYEALREVLQKLQDVRIEQANSDRTLTMLKETTDEIWQEMMAQKLRGKALPAGLRVAEAFATSFMASVFYGLLTPR